MIHTKSLIRRLDFVPWFLAACLVLVWAGESQALAVGQGGRLAVAEVDGETILLELDLTEVNEGALTKGGSHENKASVPIKVTATRLNADGSKMNDDQAKAAKKTRTHVVLSSIVGAGSAEGDPVALTMPAKNAFYDAMRFSMSMPILVIEAEKAKGEHMVDFVPMDDKKMGNDMIDEGRGVNADDGISGDAAVKTFDAATSLTAAAKSADTAIRATPVDPATTLEAAKEVAMATRDLATAAIALGRAANAAVVTTSEIAAASFTTLETAIETQKTATDAATDAAGVQAAIDPLDDAIGTFEGLISPLDHTDTAVLDDMVKNAAAALEDIKTAAAAVAAAATAAVAAPADATGAATFTGAASTFATAAGTFADDAAVNDEDEDDLRIWISGEASGETLRPAYFILRDNDRANKVITLTFDRISISKEAERLAVKVTASLDAQATSSDITFSLNDIADGRSASPDENVNAEGWDAIASSSEGDKIASRDAFYRGTDFGDIKISKNKMSAEKTIHIDPLNVHKDRLGEKNTWIALGTKSTLEDIMVVPAFIRLTDEGLPRVDSVVEISPPIYEDGGDNQEAQVRITLKAAAPAGGTVVSVTVNGVEGKGTRDTEYEADVEDANLRIAAGEKSGVVTIFVSPEDNDEKNDWQFEVHVDTGDVTEEKVATIGIVDDEGDISRIELRANPLKISEIGGAQTVTISAHVIGSAHSADLSIPLTTIGGTATREVDYKASYRSVTIPANQIMGEQEITITPVADEKDDGDGKTAEETIEVGTVVVKDDDRIIKIGDKDIVVKKATITLTDQKTPPPEPEEPQAPIALADDDLSISGTVGMELSKPLPAATTADESAEVTYLPIAGLPDGLMFNADADERTISGTPTAAGTDTVTYYATDGSNLVSLTYIITIAPTPPTIINVASISADTKLLRENAGHATTITLTVTLAEASEADEKISLAFVDPSEGVTTAMRDEHFVAAWTMGSTITIPAGETKGTKQLSVTPIDNSSPKDTAFGVQATTTTDPDGAKVDITIADDESSSSAIVLSVDPATVTEKGGPVSVAVTATLSGGELDDAVTVTVGISGESTATRDGDYTASFAAGATQIAIAAGETSGTTSVTITPVADDKEETGEVIVLTGMADDLATGSAVIALEDGGEMPPGDDGEGADDGEGDDGEGDDGEGDDGEGDDGEGDDGEGDGGGMMPFAFAEEVGDQAYTAGTAIEPLVLPAAENGEGDVTYKVYGLPAGLAFDDSTRTISGTPEAATAEPVEVTVLATDSEGAGIALTFTITVNAPLSFGDLFGAAGKIVPDSHGLMTEIREFVIGQRVEGITLPEGAGGTAPLTYSLSPALPAGLTFDAVTRTIAGTPTAASETVYTYTVTDASGASLSLALQTLPAAFSLADNFPNPFNPATTIQYALPQAADVELTVYNVLGQPVRTLVAEHQNAGRYVVEWDATNDNGHSLSSGMYFYRLQAGGEFLKVKKMLLLK